MTDEFRRREVEVLNDLSRLCPLGTLSAPLNAIALPSPEPEAPDSWHWLPPGNFPAQWEWLDVLSSLNAIRLTYLPDKTFVVRVYVVPEDVRKLGVLYNRKGKDSFRRLLQEVDNSPESWSHGVHSGTRSCLLKDEAKTTLAQIYNTLESPTAELPSHPVLPHELYALQAIRNNGIPALSAQLYPYQARTVQRMFLQELYPSEMLDPRLIRVVGPLKNDLFLQLDDYKFWKLPTIYQTSSGGILGEEMGSGKTCESLALILVTLDQTPANPAHLPGSTYTDPLEKSRSDRQGVRSLQDLAAETVQKRSVPYRWSLYGLSDNCINLLESYRPSYFIPPPPLRIRLRRTLLDDEGKEIIRTDTRPGTQQWLSHATLVVVPDTLVSQWRHEITKHVQADTLRVLVIASSSKRLQETIPPIEELLRFDIVLISHSRFSREEEQIMTSQHCKCSYKGRTNEVDCSCPPPIGYTSPLTSIHWKRLIVDEGHTMSSSQTKAVRFAASLNVERKWVVSGTPSRGLVGASADGQEGTQNEKFDLERLAVTLIDFLGFQALDKQTWKKYISKPFLERSLGAEQVVRSLLNSTIVRNRQSDIQKDVVLPPLTKNVVFLDATRETVLVQNIFNALIAINAVTSQRIDQDYFFHKSQNSALQAVVRNMLVSTFHWTGTSLKDIHSAHSVAVQALKVHGAEYSSQDCRLLRSSCHVLQRAMSSDLWLQTSVKHEMGYYLSAPLPEDAAPYYTLSDERVTVLGGTAVIEAQRAVRDGLAELKTDDVTMDEHLIHSLTSSGIKKRAREEKARIAIATPAGIAGLAYAGASVVTNAGGGGRGSGSGSSPTKASTNRGGKSSHAKTQLTVQRNRQITEAVDQAQLAGEDLVATPAPAAPPLLAAVSLNGIGTSPTKKPSGSSPKVPRVPPPDQTRSLNRATTLASLRITSTSSAKLNYLLTQIHQHSVHEKIIVFSDFVDHTFHLAEALDIIGVPYLLYTSSLKPALKNRYILTFNTSETFRVMIMDLQLAAHGLNLSTASRVYFIQQCWSGAIESQAIKRAHRIGQTRPVRVEILVLRASIEELMQRRRTVLTGRELGDTKTVTDDAALCTAIKHPTFAGDPEAQALLDPPFPLFFVGCGSGEGEAGLVSEVETAAVIDSRPVSPTLARPPLRDSGPPFKKRTDVSAAVTPRPKKRVKVQIKE